MTTDTPAIVSDSSPTAEAERERMRAALEQGHDFRLSTGWTNVGLAGKPPPDGPDRRGFRFEHSDGAKLTAWPPSPGPGHAWDIWPEAGKTYVMRCETTR